MLKKRGEEQGVKQLADALTQGFERLGGNKKPVGSVLPIGAALYKRATLVHELCTTDEEDIHTLCVNLLRRGRAGDARIVWDLM